ncbi:ABC transporter permease [Paraburkholderia caballeronis]|uniref:ABC transporter permease n=1 Tax=Paraburkholderia caballeronis TaxID=416943 RepID=UPI001AD81FB7|nr:iron ABC transporter permease [Paraburkholderia caballeronis]
MTIVLAAIPLLYVLLGSMDAGVARLRALLFRPYIGMLLMHTAQLAVSVTAGSIVLGIGAAWLVERSDLPMRSMWRTLLPLPLAVPAFVSSFAWVSIGPVFEGIGGAVFILALAEYPLIYLPAAAALRGMDPALDEIAQSLGLSRWEIFWRSTVPQLRPVIANGALLVISHMLVEFGAFAFLRVQTFTTAIYEEFDLEFNSATGVSLAAVLLVLCLLLLAFEARMKDSLRRYARVGTGTRRAAHQIRLRAWRWPAMAVLLTPVATGVGVPVATLLYWVTSGHSRATVGEMVSATGTTVWLGALGALAATALGTALALSVRRYRGAWLARIASRLPFFIHALPGLVIALALVFVALRYADFLYQTTALLVVGYVTLYVPLVQTAVHTPLAQLPERIEEVARSLGHGPLSVFVGITLPNISAGIGAGAALVFLQVMKELTATLILLPTGLDTLSIEIWQHARDMEYAAAAPYALLLIVLSGVPVYLLMRDLYGRDRTISSEWIQ